VSAHDGRCGFCGTAVLQGFNTCPNCHAVWKQDFTPFGRFVGLVLSVPTFLALLMLPLGLAKGDGEGLLMAGGAAVFLFVVFRVITPACAVWAWWRRL
jgi:hypothetical protein